MQPLIQKLLAHKKPIIGVSMVLLAIAAILIARKANAAGRKIVAAAKRYVGIRENGNNNGWNNADFEAKMKSAGWYSGAEWCNFFVRMLLLELTKGSVREFVNTNITGSTQLTWKNLQTPSKYHEVLKTPCKGALIIYQKLNDPSHGHIEIFVNSASDGGYYVISGNSNFKDKSGQGVAYVQRPKTGLNNHKILGYIKIKKL